MRNYQKLLLKQILFRDPQEDAQRYCENRVPKYLRAKKKIGATHQQKWSIEENEIYLMFLNAYADDFKDEYTRRSSKVFKRMAQKMGGRRDPQQCRGHHKKMAEKHETIQQIKNAIELKIQSSKKKLTKFEVSIMKAEAKHKYQLQLQKKLKKVDLKQLDENRQAKQPYTPKLIAIDEEILIPENL